MNNINISTLSKFNIQEDQKEYLRNKYLRQAIEAQEEINTLLKNYIIKDIHKKDEKKWVAIMLAHQHIKLIQLSLFDLEAGKKNIADITKEVSN